MTRDQPDPETLVEDFAIGVDVDGPQHGLRHNQELAANIAAGGAGFRQRRHDETGAAGFVGPGLLAGNAQAVIDVHAADSGSGCCGGVLHRPSQQDADEGEGAARA